MIQTPNKKQDQDLKPEDELLLLLICSHQPRQGLEFPRVGSLCNGRSDLVGAASDASLLFWSPSICPSSSRLQSCHACSPPPSSCQPHLSTPTYAFSRRRLWLSGACTVVNTIWWPVDFNGVSRQYSTVRITLYFDGLDRGDATNAR